MVVVLFPGKPVKLESDGATRVACGAGGQNSG